MVYVIEVCWQLASRIRTELSSVLILPASCQQICMTYTIVVCTVKNSWWWTEELFETCRVLVQKQIWEISVSSWFYYKNVDQVWNVADGGNGSARGMEPDPSALCAQQIPHGLAGVWVGTAFFGGRRLTDPYHCHSFSQITINVQEKDQVSCPYRTGDKISAVIF